MASPNLFDNMKLIPAALKTVNQAEVIRFNKSMYYKGGMSYSSLSAFEPNKIGFAKNFTFYASIFEGYRGDMSSYNQGATGINYNTDSSTPFTVDNTIDDFVIYIEVTKIKNRFPNLLSGECSSIVVGIPTNVTLIPPDMNTATSHTAFNNYGTSGEDFSEWYIITTQKIYNRPLGSQNARQLTSSEPIIPYIGTNFSYCPTAGIDAGKKIYTINHTSAVVSILNPSFWASSGINSASNIFSAIYFGQQYQVNPSTAIITKSGVKECHLGENIKFVGVGTDTTSNKYEVHDGEKVIHFYGEPNQAFLAFKTIDDILAFYNDLGLPYVTQSQDIAISQPRDVFPDAPVLDGDNNFVPDDGNPTGYDNNPIIPEIPSFPDNTSDLIPDISPNVSSLNGCSAFCLNLGNVKAFMQWLLTDDFTKNISELFSDKLSSLNAIQLFPFDFVQHDESHLTQRTSLTIANVNCPEIECYSIDSGYNVWFDGGEINYLAYYGDYNDYINAKYSIYIPYCGIIDIAASFVVNCTLTIRYAIDLLTGNATAVIRSNNVIVKLVPCHVSQNIPIIYSNANQQAIKDTLTGLSIADNVVGSIINIATGNYAGVVGNILGGIEKGAINALTNPMQFGHIGSISPSTSQILPQSPFLIITRCQVAKYSQSKSYGKPISFYGKLSSFIGIGFIQLSTCISIIGATAEEENEIRQLLEEGILL